MQGVAHGSADCGINFRECRWCSPYMDGDINHAKELGFYPEASDFFAKRKG